MYLPNDQVRSGQVGPDDLDLKTYIQHSTCHTEATYQISCQSGHRAQSNHCRYTNRLRSFTHFRNLHIKAGISKSFKLSDIFLAYTMEMFHL